ncbi:MAG: hypothetical protein VW405_01365 [Rhodospirillaceae bacterium]
MSGVQGPPLFERPFDVGRAVEFLRSEGDRFASLVFVLAGSSIERFEHICGEVGALIAGLDGAQEDALNPLIDVLWARVQFSTFGPERLRRAETFFAMLDLPPDLTEWWRRRFAREEAFRALPEAERRRLIDRAWLADYHARRLRRDGDPSGDSP